MSETPSPDATRPVVRRAPLWPGLLLAGVAALVAYGVQQLVPAASPVLVAILLGIVLTNVRPLPERTAPGLAVAGRRVLRLGIVLLGLQLSLREILGLGAGVIATVVAIVGLGIVGTLVLGSWLGVPATQRLLIATGFSICGAAAVAAVEGEVEADETDTATAIGLVVVFGTLMIGIAPLLLGATSLSIEQQGLISGGAIHEVAQVVAAGGIIGGGALGAAVVVKLARVLMLAPVIVVIGAVRRRQGAHTQGKRPPLVPLFVAGFLAAVLARTSGLLPEPLLQGASIAQTLLLSAAMFSLGTGVRLDLMRQIGGRPVLLGALSTVWVSAIATTGILLAT